MWQLGHVSLHSADFLKAWERLFSLLWPLQGTCSLLFCSAQAFHTLFFSCEALNSGSCFQAVRYSYRVLFSSSLVLHGPFTVSTATIRRPTCPSGASWAAVSDRAAPVNLWVVDQAQELLLHAPLRKGGWGMGGLVAGFLKKIYYSFLFSIRKDLYGKIIAWKMKSVDWILIALIVVQQDLPTLLRKALIQHCRGSFNAGVVVGIAHFERSAGKVELKEG